MLSRNSEMLSRYSEMLSRYSEMLRRYSEMPCRYSEMLSRYSDLVNRYSEMLSRYCEIIYIYTTSFQGHRIFPLLSHNIMIYYVSWQNERENYICTTPFHLFNQPVKVVTAITELMKATHLGQLFLDQFGQKHYANMIEIINDQMYQNYI